MAISLDKIEREAPELLSLVKTATQTAGLKRLNGQKSKVALCLDFSGSMSSDYKNGSMQRLCEKVLALATQLDDDGAIDLFVFDTQADYLGEVTLQNFRGVIAEMTKCRHMGTTNYADQFRKLLAHFKLTPQVETVVVGQEEVKGGLFRKASTKDITEERTIARTSPLDEPVLAIFLTDGVPNNRKEAIAELTRASYAPVFWQFLSIGAESIPFLEKLDDLENRYIDNADYKPVGNVDKVGDSELFEMLLDEYPDWVLEERKRNQIR